MQMFTGICVTLQLSVLDKYEHALAQVNDVAMKRLEDHEGQVNILSVCNDPQVLAQQLCHVELVSSEISSCKKKFDLNILRSD